MHAASPELKPAPISSEVQRANLTFEQGIDPTQVISQRTTVVAGLEESLTNLSAVHPSVDLTPEKTLLKQLHDELDALNATTTKQLQSESGVSSGGPENIFKSSDTLQKEQPPVQENPYISLSLSQMKETRRTLRDKRVDAYDAEVRAREEATIEVANVRSEPIVFEKQELNTEPEFPVHFNALDQIEIRLQIGEDGKPHWFIRNRTIADKETVTPPTGVVEVGTADDVEEFIQKVDATKIGTHKLKSIPRELREGSAKGKKVYTFKIESGHITGIAFVSDNNSRVAHLNILATDPAYENQGIGSALITGLKRRYDGISLNAVPFDMNPNRAQAITRLNNFYKRTGFVAGEWSQHTISLDDVTTAGLWQQLDQDTIYNVGNGQHLVSTTEVINMALLRILSDEGSRSQLPDSAVTALGLWDERHRKRLEVDRKLALLTEAEKNARSNA